MGIEPNKIQRRAMSGLMYLMLKRCQFCYLETDNTCDSFVQEDLCFPNQMLACLDTEIQQFLNELDEYIKREGSERSTARLYARYILEELLEGTYFNADNYPKGMILEERIEYFADKFHEMCEELGGDTFAHSFMKRCITDAKYKIILKEAAERCSGTP